MPSYIKDDKNDDDLEACIAKNSKTLGQCILGCKDDTSCESACVSSFKTDYSECPCQVIISSNSANVIFS